MKTLIVAGHARLPGGMAAKSLYETITITAEVDHKYGVIIEASCTLATEHARTYFSALLKGYSLQDGLEEPLQEIRTRYLGKASNALESALKDLYKQYQQVNS